MDTYTKNKDRLDVLMEKGELDTPEWDRLVNESRGIRENNDIHPGMTGEDLYRKLAAENKSMNLGKPSPQEATSSLDMLGIKGIQYNDAMSRGAEGGTKNYVTFDDKLMSIVDKYGVAGLTAGALGATAALTPEQGMANQPELALSEMTFGNGKPTAKMREAAMTELANRGIGPENIPRARFDVNAPNYNKGRRSIGDYFEGGGKKLAGAADLVGGMAYGLGQESVRGLTGLGGMAMGRGVDESMRNADALVNQMPQYNVGENAVNLYQDAEKSYESNPEIAKKVMGEYLGAGDYWGEKVGEYSPAAGAAIKTAFDIVL